MTSLLISFLVDTAPKKGKIMMIGTKSAGAQIILMKASEKSALRLSLLHARLTGSNFDLRKK